MWPDGICRISDSHYTKTIQFQDINYQLSQNEDKTAIFEGCCDFLNYFDSSIHFQLSFLNLAASEETFANSISIPPQRDAFDSIREEYTTMLQNQLARGNNGLIKTKYLTFGIDADSIKDCRLIFVLGELIVDVLKLNDLCVVAVRYAADPVRPHPFIRDTVLRRFSFFVRAVGADNGRFDLLLIGADSFFFVFTGCTVFSSVFPNIRCSR